MKMKDGVAVTVAPKLGAFGSYGVSLNWYPNEKNGPRFTVAFITGLNAGIGIGFGIEDVYLADGVSSADTLGLGYSSNYSYGYSQTEDVGPYGNALASQDGFQISLGGGIYTSYTIDPSNLSGSFAGDLANATYYIVNSVRGVIDDIISNPSAFTVDAAGAIIPLLDNQGVERDLDQQSAGYGYFWDRQMPIVNDPAIESLRPAGFIWYSNVVWSNDSIWGGAEPYSSNQFIEGFPYAPVSPCSTFSASSSALAPQMEAGLYNDPADQSGSDYGYIYYENFSNIDINYGSKYQWSQGVEPSYAAYLNNDTSESGANFGGWDVNIYSDGFGVSFTLAFPVVLDLNRDGVSITPRTSSIVYRDVNGDGDLNSVETIDVDGRWIEGAILSSLHAR